MPSTPAADEIGFYTPTSPFGTVAEIPAASLGDRAGASNDLLSAPAIKAPDLEPRDRLLAPHPAGTRETSDSKHSLAPSPRVFPQEAAAGLAPLPV